jgi:hypothetical protein
MGKGTSPALTTVSGGVGIVDLILTRCCRGGGDG